MAENTVVKEYLSPEMVESGAKLIAQLDEMGLPVVAAFWFFDSETNEWILRVATPDLEIVPTPDIYLKIRQARQALGEQAAGVPMLGVRLASVNDKTVRVLRNNLHTDPKVLSRVRLRKTAFDGHYMDDVLVYRAA
jgi:hypothetical protein